MGAIEHIGFDSLTGRELFLLAVMKPDDMPETIELGCQHFACFIAWDCESASVEEISSVVEPLMRAGAAYFCTWGSGCQRVHDIVDELDAYPFNSIGAPEGSVIMTSWHDDESLEEALHYFLTYTSPDEYFENTLKASLAISIGSDKWPSVIHDALRNTEVFRNMVEGEDE
jgi:hypothetical protein